MLKVVSNKKVKREGRKGICERKPPPLHHKVSVQRSPTYVTSSNTKIRKKKWICGWDRREFEKNVFD